MVIADVPATLTFVGPWVADPLFYCLLSQGCESIYCVLFRGFVTSLCGQHRSGCCCFRWLYYRSRCLSPDLEPPWVMTHSMQHVLSPGTYSKCDCRIESLVNRPIYRSIGCLCPLRFGCSYYCCLLDYRQYLWQLCTHTAYRNYNRFCAKQTVAE